MKNLLLFLAAILLSAGNAAAYELVKVAGALKIDGIAETAWQQAKPIKLFKWRDSKLPVFMPSTVKFLYDDTNLYCLAEFQEVNLNEALMQSTKYPHRDAPVYSNDCCELFIDPFRDGKRVFHLIVDIHGGVADYLCGDTVRFRNELSWNGYWRSAVHISSEQWNVEYAIPWNTIGVKPGKARQLGVNLSRSRRCNPTERTVIVDKLALRSTPDYIQMKADIAPLPVTGSIEYGAFFSGSNSFSVILQNAAKRTQNGILLISGTYSDGKRAFTMELPVSAAPRQKLTIPVKVNVPAPGNVNISADLQLDKAKIFIGSTNVKIQPPFDINDPHPLVFQNEKWGIYLQIFTAGTRDFTVVIKQNGKVAARAEYPALQGRNFVTLPTGNLLPGEYDLSFISGKDTVSVPLLIIARP